MSNLQQEFRSFLTEFDIAVRTNSANLYQFLNLTQSSNSNMLKLLFKQFPIKDIESYCGADSLIFAHLKCVESIINKNWDEASKSQQSVFLCLKQLADNDSTRWTEIPFKQAIRQLRLLANKADKYATSTKKESAHLENIYRLLQTEYGKIQRETDNGTKKQNEVYIANNMLRILFSVLFYFKF
eukprot:TRINITY_DN1312_c0_g2_i2.p1 TRINITY_DN1312_c0_g2~~TRINITY_DN1312_c0_g2_i2.p1  ORF type:complete len:184 (-),score=67.30 TRINITY_DN1312_c0_g2_i2:16-567(-)